jgi:F-type H+-transporting ATPase subunit b
MRNVTVLFSIVRIALLSLALVGWSADCLAQAETPATTAPAAAEDHGADHDHADHAHAIGHEGVSGDPHEFKADLAIYTFIVFMLLLGILWKFAWGPITEGLEKREHGIAENIAAAERSHQQAKAMLAEYERKLASSADEVRAIIDEARRDAEHTQQEILAKARADAQAERDRSLREIETAKDQALKELGERGANLAVDLAGKIVRAQLNPADHTRLIEEAMARFPNGNPSKN